jgi:hypothetical protein
MKRLLSFVVLFGVCGVAAYYLGARLSGRFFSAFTAAASTTHTRPFSARMVRISGANGPEVEYIHAVRSDGAVARISLSPKMGASAEIPHREMELPNGFTATVFPPVRAISSGYRTKRMIRSDVANRWLPETNCVRMAGGSLVHEVKLLGADTFQGLHAVRLLLDDTPKMRMTVWAIPELGCYHAQKVTEFKDPSGSIVATSREYAQEIRLGEPDPQWFVIPAGYEEMPPSQAMLRVTSFIGRECPDCLKRSGEAKDTVYQMLRKTPDI